MKKMLTLRNILLVVGALLAVVAFFLAFGATLFTVETAPLVGEVKTTFTGIIIGKQTMVMEAAGAKEVIDVPADEVVRATLSLVGIIMMLVAGLAAAVLGIVCKDKKWCKIALIACAVIILVGAIFVFVMKDSYIASAAKKQGLDIEEVKAMVGDAKVSALGIISGVVGVLAAAGVGASAFVKD